MGGGQYQREVTLATETGWVNFVVAWVGLLFHMSKIIAHFTGGARHNTWYPSSVWDIGNISRCCHWTVKLPQISWVLDIAGTEVETVPVSPRTHQGRTLLHRLPLSPLLPVLVPR